MKGRLKELRRVGADALISLQLLRIVRHIEQSDASKI